MVLQKVLVPPTTLSKEESEQEGWDTIVPG
jgi:hypothetical protein